MSQIKIQTTISSLVFSCQFPTVIKVATDMYTLSFVLKNAKTQVEIISLTLDKGVDAIERLPLSPTLDICKRLGITQHVWDNYNQLQEEILTVEHEIEESSIGHELMQVFRFDALSKKYTTPLHMRVIRALCTYIISVVRQNRYEKVSVKDHGHLLTDVVNIIRENPETFPEWHDSCVSELIEPPLFENKKNASGYFF